MKAATMNGYRKSGKNYVLDYTNTDAGEIVDRFLNAEWEWFDVSIRCYLLGEMISTVVRDLVELGAIRFAA